MPIVSETRYYMQLEHYMRTEVVMLNVIIFYTNFKKDEALFGV